MKAIRSAHSLLGTDGANTEEDFQQINKACTYAEMAFDQMQLNADMKVVDGDVAGNMLDRVMKMLGGNPKKIEAAKAAAKARAGPNPLPAPHTPYTPPSPAH